MTAIQHQPDKSSHPGVSRWGFNLLKISKIIYSKKREKILHVRDHEMAILSPLLPPRLFRPDTIHHHMTPNAPATKSKRRKDKYKPLFSWKFSLLSGLCTNKKIKSSAIRISTPSLTLVIWEWVHLLTVISLIFASCNKCGKIILTN